MVFSKCGQRSECQLGAWKTHRKEEHCREEGGAGRKGDGEKEVRGRAGKKEEKQGGGREEERRRTFG